MERKVVLPEKFLIGASSSAWQTEGWAGKDGRMNYMDLWYKKTPECWYEGYGPTVATDFYHRYQEDIELMKQCGLQVYRTSIDWSRFIRNYDTAEVDPDALAYYGKLIDSLIAAGIEPMICLEHYELPAELFETYGGWGSKYVVECFVKYAQKVFEAFGNRVKYWFTFNEPIVIQTRIYLDAVRWPYEQDSAKWIQWNYYKVLAHAKTVELYHKMELGGKIGIILNPEVVYPRSQSPGDRLAAHIYDLYFNRMYLDPCLKGEFPDELLKDLETHQILFESTPEELQTIRENVLDILGLNLYFPKRVQEPSHVRNSNTAFHPCCYYEEFVLPGREMNKDRGWEIYPRIVYDMGMRIKEEYGNIPWLITENGMGIMGEDRFLNQDGMVEDDIRIDFIKRHLEWAVKSVEDGANCLGYLVWAFTDCVSPGNAFKNRYGLVSINLKRGRNRTIKKSGYFYRKMSQERYFTMAKREYR